MGDDHHHDPPSRPPPPHLKPLFTKGVPLTAGPVEVADRVDDVTARVDDRAAAADPGGYVWGEDLPFGVAGVGRVVPGPAGRQMIGESGGGGRRGGPGDKVYRQGGAFGFRASGLVTLLVP